MPVEIVHTSNSLHQESVVALLSAASRVRCRVVRLLQTQGVSPSQYNVLRILRGSQDGLATMEIAARLVDREPGITRLIDGLLARGHVERIPSSVDRRRVDCRITALGLDVLRQFDTPVEELDREMLCNLSGSDLRKLTRLLDQIAT